MLYDVNRIITGGETNYISATLALYIDIYMVFQNLLALLGIFGGDDVIAPINNPLPSLAISQPCRSHEKVRPEARHFHGLRLPVSARRARWTPHARYGETC